jgi:hypothetical protein
MADLLSSGIWLEAPFIILDVGGIRLGAFDRKTKRLVEENGSMIANQEVFPNFVQSGTITKNANGMVNQYRINLVYQITQENDPNFIAKVFSRVQKGRRAKITYGDMNNPTYVFRDEECIIGNVGHSMDLKNGTVTYNVDMVSATALRVGRTYNWVHRIARPSKVFRDVLYNKEYGLMDVLTGMRNEDKVNFMGLISVNDVEVEILAQNQISPIEYLRYLVSCMRTDARKFIQDDIFALVFDGDATSELGGPHIKIVNTNGLRNTEGWTVDIGYPGITDVFDFQVREENMYSILYEYEGELAQGTYVREIGQDGKVQSVFGSPLALDPTLQKTTADAITWWTRMTQFPVSGTLTVRGLIKPVILMDVVRINQYFFGKKYMMSGRYIITSQRDEVNSNGYRTVLGLIRIGE